MTTFEPRAIGGDMPLNAESHSATTAVFNTNIATLTAFKGTLEASPVRAVFESVIVILTLVRDEMIEEDPFVGLAKTCIRSCHVLKTMADLENLDSRKQIEDLERIVRRIESAVVGRADCAQDSQGGYPGSIDECLISWRAELLERLRTLDGSLGQGGALEVSDIRRHVQRPLDPWPSMLASTTAVSVTTEVEGLSEESSLLAPAEGSSSGSVEGISLPVLVGSGEAQSMGMSAPPVPPFQDGTKQASGSSLVLDPGERALQCLISGAFHRGGLASLIETIFSNMKATDIIGCLRENDAQTFVDVIHEALETLNLAPEIRKKCLKSLYKTCAGHTLLPSSLQIELLDSPTGVPLCRGGFGDVWKCEYREQDVAVKVLRRYVYSDWQKITRRFCKEFITWKALRHPNVLPLMGVIMSETRFAMVSEWMPNGNINQFVKAHRNANRFILLGDVARGLVYMHEQGMVHGDLKGANVLIDHTEHARLADFGLLTIMSGATTSTPSFQGGTHCWMSPELFDPEDFGLKFSRPTVYSDCYALGMTIYEVLSEQRPFHQCRGYVFVKIIKGERPRRPQGVEGMWFTDDVWGTLKNCWEPIPGDRPNIASVLHCLENASGSWASRSQTIAYPPATDPPVRIFDLSIGESTDEDDTSCLSQAVPSHQSRGHAKDLSHDTLEYQDPEASARHPKGPDLEESAGILNKASPANCPSQISALRRLETHNRRKALPESHPSRSGGEAADAEAVELHNPVLGRSGEKDLWRMPQPLDAVHLTRGLFQIREKGKAAGYVIPSFFSPRRALQWLIGGAFHRGGLTSLIDTIFSSRKATDIVGCLRENDAQTFVDVIHEALETLNLAPEIRKKCLKSLYKTCAGHTLLPSSLQIELPDSLMGVALYHGGFGDVWKCEYQGQDVAVKVLRRYVYSDLQKITRRFCKEFITWKTLRHPNVLPLMGVIMSETRFAMVSEWMPNGNINQFVKAHRNANRFILLRDVARGLVYMHEQGMVHGDLRGANVLIDHTEHARLADFGLLTIRSGAANVVSSTPSLQGGTHRWMSPELFDPEDFGLKDSRPTVYSDCYALGMTIYEVLSEQRPFYQCRGCVFVKIIKGERPGRPQGVEGMWFTDDVWGTLEHCWEPIPGDRPSITSVLHCLENASGSWASRSQTIAYPPATDPPVRIFDLSIGESTDEDDTSCLSQAVPSHQSRGHAKDLPHNTLEYQDPEASARHPNGPDLVESAGILNKASPTNSPFQESALRRRETGNRRKALPQSHPSRSEGETAHASAVELHDPVLGRSADKDLWGPQPPDAVQLTRGLFQIRFEKGKAAGYLILFLITMSVTIAPTPWIWRELRSVLGRITQILSAVVISCNDR